MLGLLMAGALLGSFVVGIVALVSGGMSTSYQTVLSYPIMFIPPMIYAVSMSHREEMFDGQRVALDSGKPSWTLMVLCAIGTIAFSVIVEPLINLLPPMPDFLENALKTLSDGPLVPSFLAASIFAPFFEEWLCRGMVMRGLLHHTKPATAIIVSAVFFAVIHLNPWQAIPAFILGCVFGLVYYKTGSLKLTMLMHFANNTFSILISRLPEFQGKDSLDQVITDQLSYGLVYASCLAISAYLLYYVWKLEEHRAQQNDPATPLE